MKIKRTFAPTMREALLIVKQEQGDDAVILGNKKVPGGIEILSAVDFDEVAMNSLQTPQVTAPTITPPRIDIPLDEPADDNHHSAMPEVQSQDDWAETILNQKISVLDSVKETATRIALSTFKETAKIVLSPHIL